MPTLCLDRPTTNVLTLVPTEISYDCQNETALQRFGAEESNAIIFRTITDMVKIIKIHKSRLSELEEFSVEDPYQPFPAKAYIEIIASYQFDGPGRSTYEE